MDNLLFIDFNDYTPAQICEFVNERLHDKVKEKISYINQKILSNSIKKEVYNSEFHTYYIDLTEKLERLINLEKHILFKYVQSSELKDIHTLIPFNSIQHIQQFQYNIKHTLLYVRVSFQELEKNASYSTITSIIEIELLNLETLIIQWFQIVNKNILIREKGRLN